jgi:hypothetical protein
VPQAIRGNTGLGSVDVYTAPRDHELRLDLLTFTLTTDATAGVHSPLVTITDSQLGQVIARLWDWNEGGPSMTLYYTFGRGLRPFNCTLTTGMFVPVHLPDTILEPDAVITVSSVDVTGTEIPGDAITAVAVYGELISVVDDAANAGPPLLPGWLPGAAT